MATATKTTGVSASEAAYLANLCLGPSAARTVTESSVKKIVHHRIADYTLAGKRRVFDSTAPVFLAWSHAFSGVSLDAARKRMVYRWMIDLHNAPMRRKGAAKHKPLSLGPAMSIAPDETLFKWLNTVDDYVDSRSAYITSDPEIMGGAPVIKGTRIPVHTVMARLEGGDAVDELVSEYVDIPKEAFTAALSYAKANPRSGRPALRLR
ncbi:MAG: DUF433 domain-containing protein [Rhodospirillales bacterium]